MEVAISERIFSAKAYARLPRVAQTIANLAEEENIRSAHLSEAIQCRMMDRYY